MISKKQAAYGECILLIAMMIGGGILWFGKAQARPGSLGYHAVKINENFVSEAVFHEEQNEFFQRWHRTAAMLRKSDEERQDLLVDTIIDRAVVEEFLLKRSGVQVGPQEIEFYLNHFIKTKYATESEFQEYLDSVSCATENDLKKLIQIYLLKLKCFPGIALQYGVRAPQTEIEGAYQRQKTENWSVVLQHILLSPQKNGGIQSQWKLASRIARQLEKGADFAMLARKYSDDQETQNKGGLLEPLAKEKVPPAFDTRIFDAKPGEVIPPFLTDYGIEILKVLKPLLYIIRPFTTFHFSYLIIKHHLTIMLAKIQSLFLYMSTIETIRIQQPTHIQPRHMLHTEIESNIQTLYHSLFNRDTKSHTQCLNSTSNFPYP